MMATPAEQTAQITRDTAPKSAQSLLASALESVPETNSGEDSPISALEEHLKQILKAESSTLADRLQVLDLSLLKEKFGDQWERVAEIAHPAAERAITQHLTKTDFHSRYQDAYIIVCAEEEREDALRKCAKIYDTLSNWLFGEGQTSDLVTAKSVTKLETDELKFTDVPPLSSFAPVTNEIENSGEAIEDWVPKSGTLPRNLQFIYRAMWNARQQSVSSYLCLPAFKTQDGTTHVGEELLPDDVDPDLTAELDQLTLAKIATYMLDLPTAAKRAFLAFPIHYTTFGDSAARKKCLDLLGKFPSSWRRRLIAEVVGIPSDATTIDVRLVLGSLKPKTLGVLGRFTIEQQNFNALREGGLLGVGAELSGWDRGEADLMPLMEIFTEAANQQKLKTYVHGLSSLSLTTAAVCAGFDHVDGEAVSTLVNLPEGIYPLSPEVLYQRLLDGED